MTIDPTTGRVVGEHYFIAVDRGSPESITLGGAEFAASFGPGRYSVFTCVDFKGDGYNFTSPTEWGSWLGNFPVGFTVNLNQVYFGELNHMEMGLACLFYCKASSRSWELFSPSPVTLISLQQPQSSLELASRLSHRPRHVQMLSLRYLISISRGFKVQVRISGANS